MGKSKFFNETMQGLLESTFCSPNLKVIEVFLPHFPTVNLRNLEDLKRLLKYRKYSMIKMLNNFLKEI